jgi:hypothetical protein
VAEAEELARALRQRAGDGRLQVGVLRDGARVQWLQWLRQGACAQAAFRDRGLDPEVALLDARAEARAPPAGAEEAEGAEGTAGAAGAEAEDARAASRGGPREGAGRGGEAATFEPLVAERERAEAEEVGNSEPMRERCPRARGAARVRACVCDLRARRAAEARGGSCCGGARARAPGCSTRSSSQAPPPLVLIGHAASFTPY